MQNADQEQISLPLIWRMDSCVIYQDGVEVHELSKTRNTLENMFPELIDYCALKKSLKTILVISNGLEN
jgi:hypothetical protein